MGDEKGSRHVKCKYSHAVTHDMLMIIAYYLFNVIIKIYLMLSYRLLSLISKFSLFLVIPIFLHGRYMVLRFFFQIFQCWDIIKKNQKPSIVQFIEIFLQATP